jgi:fructokinase
MLLCCGDALIDWIPAKAIDGRDAYVPAVGGSCCNIAVALGRLGAAAGFMGGISTDLFGDMLIAGLEAASVSTRYVARLDRATTLGFVRLGEGEPQYAFYDEGTAGRLWRRSDSRPIGPEVRLIHAGSVTLISSPVAEECLALFGTEKGRRLLSIDPNCRPSLVSDAASYRSRMARLFGLADIIRLSTGDLHYLLPGIAPHAAALHWIADGAALVVLTRGSAGATAYWAGGEITVAAREVAVADTIGAGDAFLAGLIVDLDEAGLLSVDRLARAKASDLYAALSFAAEVASIACTRSGADPPWRSEVASRKVGTPA